MKKNLVLAIMVILAMSCNSNKAPWVDLFNGTNFEGWNQKGGNAIYEIKDGVIIGTSVKNEPNSFMCTNLEYGDFILEYEYWVDSTLNSGVQFRSLSLPEYQNGRVHGYQCEIDPSERAWSAGIYDEARRGWLYPMTYNEKGSVAFKQGEWNHVRIEAIGNHIKTFLNGISCANLYDEMTPKGFIALQVHAVNKEEVVGKQVKWKKIRIITEHPEEYVLPSEAPEVNRMVNKLTESESENGWKLLFDGVTTKNWRGAHKTEFPETGWHVSDGILTVEANDGGESTNGGDIVSLENYSAFDLKLEFMITEGANSGIKYFVTENENQSGSAFGLEYQILDDKNHPDAKLYTSIEGSRTAASLYDLIKAEHKRYNGIGSWNEARIIVYPNNHVEHWLNGFKVLEYERGSEEFKNLVQQSKYAADAYNNPIPFGEAKEGRILLQDHGNEVSFRSIKIKELE